MRDGAKAATLAGYKSLCTLLIRTKPAELDVRYSVELTINIRQTQ